MNPTEYVQKSETSVSINGLGCLVQALAGSRIIIDLQNESTVAGVAKEVDGYMNITLEDVTYENNDGDCINYETMYVKGRNIRYIHLPKDLSVRGTILKFLKSTQGGRKTVVKTTAMQRYKMNKLMERQKETRLEVERQKKNRLDKSVEGSNKS